MGQPVLLLSHHSRLLALSGIDEQVQRSAGLTSHVAGEPGSNHPKDLPAGILLPVSDRDGTVATVRLFPERDPLGKQPIDLGQFDRGAIPHLDIDGDVRLVPTSFIAYAPNRGSGAVLVCTHDLCALALGARTGLTAVSTFGAYLLEQSIERATELAAGAPVILALYFGPSVPRAAVRRATAIAGVLGRDVRIATWAGHAIEVVPRAPLAVTRSVKPGGLWGTRSLISPGPRILFKGEGLGPVAGEIVGGLVRAGMRAVVSRTSRERLPIQPLTPSGANLLRTALLRTAADIERLAASRGATVALLGGVAIDVVIGRQVRPRKDIDLAVAGGPPDTLEYLADELVARGFELLYRRSRSQAVLRCGPLLVDLYRLLEGRDGALLLATRTSFARFSSQKCFVEVSRDGIPLRVLAPPFLYQLKLYKATNIGNLSLRSQWRAASPDRIDLAALRSVVAVAEGIRRSRNGELQLVRILSFAFRPLPRLIWWRRSAAGSDTVTKQ